MFLLQGRFETNGFHSIKTILFIELFDNGQISCVPFDNEKAGMFDIRVIVKPKNKTWWRNLLRQFSKSYSGGNGKA